MAAPIILCDTAGMSEARWLACREHGPKGDIEYTVGGSDVAAIFGLSPWTTPLELWMQKKGRMKTKPKSNAGQLEMGHLLEPIAAHFFAQKTGRDASGLSQRGTPGHGAVPAGGTLQDAGRLCSEHHTGPQIWTVPGA